MFYSLEAGQLCSLYVIRSLIHLKTNIRIVWDLMYHQKRLGKHIQGEISSERYRYQWGVPKKGNIILLTIWCILRWYIVTFDKTKQLWAYPMSKTNLHHFLFMSVTLTFWVLRPFWALKSDLASVIALQLQHFVCQTFWYIKIRNPSTNKKVIPQNVKWYRFPKGLLC